MDDERLPDDAVLPGELDQGVRHADKQLRMHRSVNVTQVTHMSILYNSVIQSNPYDMIASVHYLDIYLPFCYRRSAPDPYRQLLVHQPYYWWQDQ